MQPINQYDRYDGIVEKLNIEQTAEGALSGLTFAVKDLFDVAGHITGGGNPDWHRTHAQAKANAAAVDLLLAAGARLVAKTCTDELAYSLDGINIHYGTPINPQAPNRIPGGSSSGSASMVAQGAVDFALGTDTSGSIRVPAAYCGLYSMRPTAGSISSRGVIPLAPTYDTVGWLSQTPQILSMVGQTLLKKPDGLGDAEGCGVKLLFLQNAFALAQKDLAPYLVQASQMLKQQFQHSISVSLKDEHSLEAWSEAYRIVQASQVWHSFGGWIKENRPTFAPEIEQRFAFASTVNPTAVKDALLVCGAALSEIHSLLVDNAVLCLPTTWNLAPLHHCTPQELGENRSQNFKLTCLSTLSGAPQLTIPIAGPGGLRIGLSFIAAPNRDHQLLRLAQDLAAIQWAGCP
jgi:amidase